MAIENFTTYTEVDPGADITITASKIDCEDLHARGVDAYVYKDFTADYFDALDTIYEWQLDSTASLDYPICGIAFANTVNDISGFSTTDLSAYLRSGSGSVWRVYFMRGTFTATDWMNISNDTIYYPLLERASGNDGATLKVYDDSIRTSLVDTLSVAGFGTEKWRYLYGCNVYNSANATPLFDGFIQNFDLQEAAPPSGASVSVVMQHMRKMMS